jgi:drug/metabolite transporter (DMT)-like permease
VGISIGLWIAFLSGLAWAGLDVSRKSLTRDFSAVVIATGLSLGSAVLFGVVAVVASPRMDPRAYLVPGLVSITLSLAIQVLILESVRRSELSRTIPLLSFTPVATSLFGAAILGEWPSGKEWAGIVLVFFGALTLGLSRRESSTSTRERRRVIDTGAVLMLLAAISISLAAPFDKLAVRASTTPLHGFIQSLGGAVVLASFLTFRGDLGKLAAVFRKRPAMSGAVLLVFLAMGLQFLAYRTAMVGEVETIKRVVGLVASLVAGFLIFGERITVFKVVAVGIMGGGIALMLLGAAAS